MPRRSPPHVFAYIYVLESEKDGKLYIGWTTDLRRRLGEHNEGKSRATRPRLPFQLIYYEACLSRDDAQRRERFFKSTMGHRFLKLRLQAYFRARRRAVES